MTDYNYLLSCVNSTADGFLREISVNWKVVNSVRRHSAHIFTQSVPEQNVRNQRTQHQLPFIMDGSDAYRWLTTLKTESSHRTQTHRSGCTRSVTSMQVASFARYDNWNKLYVDRIGFQLERIVDEEPG